jgi:hypothetical protein
LTGIRFGVFFYENGRLRSFLDWRTFCVVTFAAAFVQLILRRLSNVFSRFRLGRSLVCYFLAMRKRSMKLSNSYLVSIVAIEDISQPQSTQNDAN